MNSQLLRLTLIAVLTAVWFMHGMGARTTISDAFISMVTDQSNAVVTNAEVELKDFNKGTVQSTKTDREGVYRFFFLALAVYILTVAHDGFLKNSRTLTVLLGPPVT